MIDYGDFRFAAPLGVGASWFVMAMHLAGYPARPVREAYTGFDPADDGDLLKLTLVRHPCRWLGHVYDRLTCGSVRPHLLLGGFAGLDLDTFEGFVCDYLDKMPGEVGRFFASRYAADSVMLLEDQPWATLELLGSLGKGQRVLELVRALPVPICGLAQRAWNKELWYRVIAAEREYCEAYDYV